MKRLAQFDELTGFFFEREPYEPADLVPKKHDGEFVRRALEAARDALHGCADWSAGALEAAMRALAEREGWKRGALYMALRVAVTCRRVSTPLFETMAVLGRRECMERLALAVEKAAELP